MASYRQATASEESKCAYVCGRITSILNWQQAWPSALCSLDKTVSVSPFPPHSVFLVLGDKWWWNISETPVSLSACCFQDQRTSPWDQGCTWSNLSSWHVVEFDFFICLAEKQQFLGTTFKDAVCPLDLHNISDSLPHSPLNTSTIALFSSRALLSIILSAESLPPSVISL